MISFGGVYTGLLHDALEDLVDFGESVPGMDRAWESPVYWLGRSFEIDRFAPLPTRAYPGPNLSKIARPTAYRLPLPTRFNELRWPIGATRWGSIVLLATSDALDKIRKQANGANGLAQDPLPLVITSPEASTKVLSIPQMYLIQWVPLSQTPFQPKTTNQENWYALYLADDRFYWPQVATPDFKIGPLTTWASLFAKCGTALGLTILVDPIPTAYLSPHNSLNLKYEILPPVLDALAANVGMRVTVDFSGNVSVISPATASAQLTTQKGTPGLSLASRAGGVGMSKGI